MGASPDASRQGAGTTFSVVLPVRDDARALERCLGAIAAQTLQSTQIVVVDNGSDDGTVAVARRAGAVVVTEARVGIPAAAARGYDAASSELILRLDADSVPPPDWAARIVRRFDHDAALDALTGPGSFVALPRGIRGPLTSWYWRVYFDGFARRLGARPLFGSNLAMRAEAWQRVRDDVHRRDPDVHDDLDLSIHLIGAGARLGFDPDLVVPVSARPLLHPFGMLRRARRAKHTLALHPEVPEARERRTLTRR